ncbi:SPBc2 prophage-derived endonuclease yokF precursor [Mycobacteroides abscessus subsp. abscessus]|nr:SPBc2 prophage-derived endonuclease yokF precursor [Mycobacteroides abscessus subsp. abscessus]
MTRITIIITFILMSILPFQAWAHNGSRDDIGGHFRSADCVYLLHEPTELAKSATNISELITLIKKHNSNSCASELTESKVDIEGYTFSKMAVDSTSTSTNHLLELGKTYDATLEKCTDGDTATFSINGTSYKTRFLYIDTPESTNQQEPYGKEASDFSCSVLQNGQITIETDGPSLFDKYHRLLAWVFVDGKLHQEEITKAGLVEDFYDYGTYKYETRIEAAMLEAKAGGVGLYSENKEAENIQENATKEVVAPTHSEKNDASTEENLTQGHRIESKQNSGSSALGIFAIATVFLFFMFPRFSRKRGIEPLLIHKMWTKNLWVNALLLIPIYTALFFLVLVVLIVEVIRLIKLKAQE